MNRVLLGLLGLLSLTAGAGALAVHLGQIPHLDRDAALVPGTTLPSFWVLVTVAAVAILTALLCLRWLLAQVPRTPVRTWRWTDEGGVTRISTATVAAPFVEEVGVYSGVRKVEASLTGTTSAPSLALVIRAHCDANLREIRRRIDDEGLPRLKQALGAPELQSTVEFRIAPTTARDRVR